MLRSSTRTFVLFLGLALLAGLLMIRPTTVEAGIFNANNQVTYKEYWVNHNQFTGGCNDDGTPTNPSGTWYMAVSYTHLTSIPRAIQPCKLPVPRFSAKMPRSARRWRFCAA